MSAFVGTSASRASANGHELIRVRFQRVEFDGSGDEAGSWVGGAAGGVAQAGADGFDWGGAVWAVTDDPVGYVGEEEFEGGGQVMRGKKPGRRSL